MGVRWFFLLLLLLLLLPGHCRCAPLLWAVMSPHLGLPPTCTATTITANRPALPAVLACPACGRREEGGLFRFSVPLQELGGVDMQPEVFIR